MAKDASQGPGAKALGPGVEALGPGALGLKAEGWLGPGDLRTGIQNPELKTPARGRPGARDQGPVAKDASQGPGAKALGPEAEAMGGKRLVACQFGIFCQFGDVSVNLDTCLAI